MRQKQLTVKCQITGKQLPLSEAIPVDLIRSSLLPTLSRDHPQLDMSGYVSVDEVNKARVKHAEEMAEHEIEDLTKLRQEVAKSLLEHQLITKNVDQEFDQNSSVGERIADRVASFGGSWTFIIIFMVVLFTWMAVNSIGLFTKPFDPFPFIFLNLVLSCVAAIQAPVIMMSQNRQESKDRIRGENDYRINLKAELEIQHINEKIDKLLSDQWKHLLEIQQMQMEMIEELTKRSEHKA